MATITWRNVNDSGTNEALRSLMAASAGVTNSFGALQGVVRDVEAADKQAFERAKENNTNAFLDALQSRYTTPEAMQAAIASGDAEAFRQSFGNQINASLTRGAADTRLANLRQQDMAGRQYVNQVTDDRDQAVVSNLQSLALQGKTPEALEELQKISDRNKGKASQTLFNAQKDLFGFATDQTKETDRQQTHALSLRQGEAQIQASNASVAASRASTAASSVRTQLGQLELADRAEATRFKAGIQQAVQNHQNEVANFKNDLRKVARENPSMFVLGGDGNVDPNAMNKGQREAADALLHTMGMAPLSTLTSGDTAAQQKLVNALNSAGAPLSVVESVKANGDWFNTSKPAPIGNDAVAKAQRERQQAIFDQRVNDAAGGVPLKSGDFTEAMKLIGPSFPKEEGDQARRAVSEYFKKGGVEVDGVKHFLPANTIARIVQGAKNPWGWNDTGDYVRSELEKTEKDFKEKMSGAIDAQTNAKVRSTISASPPATTNQRRSTRSTN